MLEEILDALDIAESADDGDSEDETSAAEQEVLTMQSEPGPLKANRQI